MKTKLTSPNGSGKVQRRPQLSKPKASLVSGTETLGTMSVAQVYTPVAGGCRKISQNYDSGACCSKGFLLTSNRCKMADSRELVLCGCALLFSQ